MRRTKILQIKRCFKFLMKVNSIYFVNEYKNIMFYMVLILQQYLQLIHQLIKNAVGFVRCQIVKHEPELKYFHGK